MCDSRSLYRVKRNEYLSLKTKGFIWKQKRTVHFMFYLCRTALILIKIKARAPFYFFDLALIVEKKDKYSETLTCDLIKVMREFQVYMIDDINGIVLARMIASVARGVIQP